jgi:hypothetical protein
MSTKTETPEALFERVSLRLRTVGLESAVEALINVCTDKSSPSPAKATAGVALLRANGMLVDKAGNGKKGKDPSEMDGQELEADIARLKRSAREMIEAKQDADKDGGSAFD